MNEIVAGGVTCLANVLLHVALPSNNYSCEFYSCSPSLFISPIIYTSSEADPTHYLMALASRLFPDSPCGLQDISDIFKKCEDAVATIFNIQDAVTWELISGCLLV